MHLNIKFYTLPVALCHVIETCRAYSEILKLNSNKSEIFCAPPIKSVRQRRPIVYFVADNNTNDYLVNCLLRSRHRESSITLLTFDDLYEIPKDLKHYPKLENGDIYPEFLIYRSELSEHFFEKRIYRFTYSPRFAIIYMITTTKNTSFACDEMGVFRQEIFKEIETYLNRIWYLYRMFHIVLEFPFVCPGYYIIFQGKELNEPRVFKRTIISISARDPQTVLQLLLKSRRKLTKGYPVRANMFDRFPTTITDCSSLHYYIPKEKNPISPFCGMDALVMHDIIRYFNFNVIFPSVEESEEYGYVNRSTGCPTGSLKYLLEGVFDISFNSRFMIRYLDNDYLQFVNYVSSDAVCAVLKSPYHLPLWHYPFSVFGPSLWAYLALTFGIVAATAKAMGVVRKRLMNGQVETNSFISFMPIGFFGSSFGKKLPVSILAATCLMTSMILLALYQSYVNYMYTTLLKYASLKTLAELREADVPIYTSPAILDIIGAHNTSHFVLKQTDRSNLLSYGNIGTIQRKADMLLGITLNYTDQNGQPQLYIVNECYSNFFLSYIARKDFPFISEMKVYIMRLIEAGLPDAYYRWTQYSLRIHPLALTDTTYPRPFYPSDFKEERVAFCLLFAGYTLSTVVLILERWWAKRSSRQLHVLNE